MVDTNGFRNWLECNTNYSKEVVGDTVSRIKRADKILEWYDDEVYLFKIEKEEDFKNLSTSVKSQIRKAIRYYIQFRDGSDCYEKE